MKGKVIQRFPSKDRKDATFPEGLELVSVLYFRRKPVGVMSTSELSSAVVVHVASRIFR